MFDIKWALSQPCEFHSSRELREWGVRARLYKANLVLVLSMPMGKTAFHVGDESFVNIEMMEGAAKVGVKETNYFLTAGTDVPALFSIPSAYKITALTDCKLIVLARAPSPARPSPAPKSTRSGASGSRNRWIFPQREWLDSRPRANRVQPKSCGFDEALAINGHDSLFSMLA